VLLTLAVIGPAHALKGEVRLEIRTDDPEGRLAPGTTVPTEPAHAGPLTVSRLRFDGFRWFAAFEQARDRTAAEALRGVRLLVETDDDAPGGEDSEDSDEYWYRHELVGLRALRGPGDGGGRRLTVGVRALVEVGRTGVQAAHGQGDDNDMFCIHCFRCFRNQVQWSENRYGDADTHSCLCRPGIRDLLRYSR